MSECQSISELKMNFIGFILDSQTKTLSRPTDTTSTVTSLVSTETSNNSSNSSLSLNRPVLHPMPVTTILETTPTKNLKHTLKTSNKSSRTNALIVPLFETEFFVTPLV